MCCVCCIYICVLSVFPALLAYSSVLVCVPVVLSASLSRYVVHANFLFRSEAPTCLTFFLSAHAVHQHHVRLSDPLLLAIRCRGMNLFAWPVISWHVMQPMIAVTHHGSINVLHGAVQLANQTVFVMRHTAVWLSVARMMKICLRLDVCCDSSCRVWRALSLGCFICDVLLFTTRAT